VLRRLKSSAGPQSAALATDGDVNITKQQLWQQASAPRPGAVPGALSRIRTPGDHGVGGGHGISEGTLLWMKSEGKRVFRSARCPLTGIGKGSAPALGKATFSSTSGGVSKQKQRGMSGLSELY